MKIELEISEKNEATDSPWWFLVDPQPLLNTMEGIADHGEVPSADDIINTIAMSSIEGPFFSREKAEEYLNRRKYAYSVETIVWCGSGYHSDQYKNAIRVGRESND